VTFQESAWTRAALWTLFAGYAAEALFFVHWGRPFTDEGVFLAAAGLVYEGLLPYRDFPLSQGPAVPYVYGLFAELFGSSILIGRYVSFAACLATGFTAMTLARRLGGPVSAATTLVLLILNLPTMWIGTTVTTQALSTPLVVAAALSLTTNRSTALGWALAPSLLLWSTSARLTNGLAFAVVTLWTLVSVAKSQRTLFRVAGLLAVQGVIAAAPVLLAPRAASFHILSSQLTRGERGGFRYESLFEHLRGSTSFFSVAETDYFPIVPLALGLLVWLGWRLWRGWRPSLALPIREPESGRLVLVTLAALVFAPHLSLSSGFPSYFATSSVLLCIAIASALPGLVGESNRRRAIALAVATALLAVSVASASREMRTYLNLTRGGFPHFREVGRDLGALLGPDCTMVTFQTHLAIESGCRLLPGLEYSFFSYFADLPDTEAEKYAVLTPKLLNQRIGELRPEAIVISRRLVSRLRGGPGPTDEHALDFLVSVPALYRFHARFPIASGLRLPMATGQERMLLFVREDLLTD
jgi:hypothetical protein